MAIKEKTLGIAPARAAPDVDAGESDAEHFPFFVHVVSSYNSFLIDFYRFGLS